jgi:hypothetical protein
LLFFVLFAVLLAYETGAPLTKTLVLSCAKQVSCTRFHNVL